MAYDSSIPSGNTVLQRAALDRSTLSTRGQTGPDVSGSQDDNWFDTDAEGKRLPITLPEGVSGRSDVGQLADRVLAAIGH